MLGYLNTSSWLCGNLLLTEVPNLVLMWNCKLWESLQRCFMRLFSQICLCRFNFGMILKLFGRPTQIFFLFWGEKEKAYFKGRQFIPCWNVIFFFSNNSNKHTWTQRWIERHWKSMVLLCDLDSGFVGEKSWESFVGDGRVD